MINIKHFNEILEKCEKDLEDGKYNFIPSVFYIFFSDNNELKLKTAILLESTLKRLSFKNICDIENYRYYYNYYNYYQNKIQYDVKTFLTNDMTDNQKFAVIVFATFHTNGYVRESALRLLENYENFLPYIIFRLNDWVEPIRKTAEEIFAKKINIARDNELISALPCIYKLYYSSRRSKYIIDLIDERLCSKNGIITLKLGLKSKDLYTRKICVSLLLKIKNLNNDILVEHLKVEKEPFLRQRIYSKLIKSGYNALKISEQFLKDKFPANRAMALKYIYEHNKSNAFDKAIYMLFDKDTRVRELSKKIVKELNPDIDIRKMYLQAINDKTQVAILGLSENGTASDCEIIEKYLYSDKVCIIRSAMTALLRLDLEKYKDNITEMLLSEHCGVVKTAKLLIQKYCIQNFNRIYEIYQISDFENIKIKCLALLFTASKWQRLIYMLQTVSDNNIRVKEISLSAIHTWIHRYNRSFTQANENELFLIKKLISQNKKYIGKSIAKTLLFLTK